MFAGAALFFSLLNNLALFISLVVVYGALTAGFPKVHGSRRQVALGLLFGLFALGCMNAFIPVTSGVRVDQRNAIVTLSGAFGGPLSAALTAGIAAAYRTHLGGYGVISGVTGICLSGLVGTALFHFGEPFSKLRRAMLSAAIATLAILPGFLLAGPWPEGFYLLIKMMVPYGTAIYLAILFGGILLHREDGHREAEYRFRQMVAMAPEAIIVVDRAKRIRLLNATAESYCSKREQDVIGRPLVDLGWLTQETLTEIDHRLSRAHESATKASPFEINDEGNHRVLEGMIAPVFSATGTKEWMISLRDVTARKLAEDARADYEERILRSKSLEALGRLAGGVAHDFNNMLAVILGTTELLQSDNTQDPSLREDLANLARAATKASELTAQLLAFARKQVLAPQVLDPNDVVEALVPLLKRSIPENIELIVNLRPNIARVLVDATQMDQVLVNLAVNARDAMTHGGTLTISTGERRLDEEYAKAHPGVAPGQYVEIAVSDTGCGMSEDVQSRVFEPFFTTKERGKGTGLGLATVHGIVSQSGGHLHLYSEPGKGSCFRVYLPVTDRSPVEEDEVDVRGFQLSGHVLLVEDSELVRVPIRRMLVSLGFEVMEAADGKEAIRACLESKKPIDLLLTDVIMRGLGGPEVAAELQRHIPDLKVLFMSGYTENAIVHQGVLDAGINFISKPFTIDQLRAALTRVLAPRSVHRMKVELPAVGRG